MSHLDDEVGIFGWFDPASDNLDPETSEDGDDNP